MRKLLLAVIIVAACSDGTGPGATSMTALVNGAQFTSVPAPDDHVALLDTFNMSLSLLGTHVISPGILYESIGLTLSDYHGIGRYSTCATPSSVFGTYFKQNEQDTALGPFFTTDSVCGGEVDIQTYDPVTRNVAGTFHFAAVSDLSHADTVHVTDGRFSGKIAIAGIILDPPVFGPETIPPPPPLPIQRR